MVLLLLVQLVVWCWDHQQNEETTGLTGGRMNRTLPFLRRIGGDRKKRRTRQGVRVRRKKIFLLSSCC
jgi:hypothetical protein